MAYRLILTAAGKGERLGHSLPKASVPLADGVPMVAYTLRRFTQVPLKGPALITVPPGMVDAFHSALQPFAWPWAVQLIPGGNTRQESVRRALETLSDPEDIVCIHDAARPFIEADTVLACLNDAEQYGAATVAVPSADTILESDTDGFLRNTPDRARLWQCQTPQCFRLELIRKAHQEAERQQWSATDDATLVWRTGHPVRLVPGTRGNFKVTTPDDLLVARVLAQGIDDGPRVAHRWGSG